VASRPGQAMREDPRRTMAIVAALTLLALVLRIPGIDTSLWTDEIFAILQGFRTPFPETLFEYTGDNKHPLYAVLAHGASALFGEHPWTWRLPALAFGVASIPMLFLLGQRISGTREAIASAALLAVSYHHVWFSQNARGYTALTFFALATTYALVRGFSDERPSSFLLYGVAAGLGIYTHLTFLFIVFAQFLVAVMAVAGAPRGAKRVEWRGPLLAFSSGAAVTLLLYAPMLVQVVKFFLNQPSDLAGHSSPAWALAEGIRVLKLGLGAGSGLGAVVLAVGGAVGLAGLVSIARQDLRVALLLVLPVLTTLFGALAARGTMYPRFFFAMAGFALLIGMRGAFVSGAWLAKRFGMSDAFGRTLSMVAASLVIVASLASVPLNWRAPKQDFDGALAFIESQRAPGDRVVTTDVTAKIYPTYYDKPWHPVRSVADVAAERAGGRVWLVYTFPRYLAIYDSALANLVERECREQRVFPGTVGGGDVIVCTLERA
jgi:mannosyltransferase